MLAAELRQPQRISDLALDRHWEGEKILLGRADPIERLFICGEMRWHGHIPELGCLQWEENCSSFVLITADADFQDFVARNRHANALADYTLPIRPYRPGVRLKRHMR